MELQEAKEILRKYNEWIREDRSELEMPEPKQVSMAIKSQKL